MTSARVRAHEYLLERHVFRRRTSGEVIERDRKGGGVWTRFALPTWWRYDVLGGLEYRRSAGIAPDERMADAIDCVASKRGDDGRWPLDTRYPGRVPIETDDGEGRPSRWNTLPALRVLEWHSARELRRGRRGGQIRRRLQGESETHPTPVHSLSAASTAINCRCGQYLLSSIT